MEPQLFQSEIGGRTFTIQTGKVAGQADGAVTVHYGETVVLVTACVASEPRDIDFLPLTIDYEERLYAAGKIPGGFIRREGRPSQEAILASRLTDRPLRPLLPKSWRREIQIIITVLSADLENNPDILAVIGGSAALHISQVPFYGPVGAVRVGYINDQLVLNPAMNQMENSKLDLVVVSTKKEIVMVEGDAKEVSEDLVVKAMRFGHEANQTIIELQERMREAVGRAKEEIPVSGPSQELLALVTPLVEGKLAGALEKKNRAERDGILSALKKSVFEKLGEQYDPKLLSAAFEAKLSEQIRAGILRRRQHVDGRALTEVRPIQCEVALLPRTHGSGLFTRGETQVLTITTLGPVGMEQQLDGLGIEESKRFMHHYNFPPFSSGEVKRIGTPSRREIGHGALAERSLSPVIPGPADFPYTIRLVSEVLSSSGSTSMGSVCASTLSLMDAGVPIKAPVAGIAIGLVTGADGEYVVLTDIEGIEDAQGDMDFKVAGTRDGITAIQLDTKLKGVSIDILAQGLKQGRDARLHILDIMLRLIGQSRPALSQYAPRIYKITVPVDKIGTVIGPGGKMIRSIIEQTKTTIDIEDDGTVHVGATSEEAGAKAIRIIEGLTKEPEVGTVYTGKVSRILNFGAMVEILPNKEGLVHISELSDRRVEKVEDVVKIGDEIQVKLIGVDALGRLNLSRRALLEPSRPIPPPREPSGPRHPDRGRPREERPGPGVSGDRAPYQDQRS